MRIKTIASLLAAATVASLWLHVRATSIQLEARLADERSRLAQLDGLRAEHDRLSAHAPSAGQLASLRAAQSERDHLRHEIERLSALPRPAPFPTGEWVPARAWENRGRASPRATVETALWAAAGGDVAALQSLLILDDSVRNRAAGLLSRMPAEARTQFASPEALVASVTLRQIPLADAQIAWLHDSRDGRAAVGLLLSRPEEPPVPLPAPISTATPVRTPPMLPPTQETKLVILSLQQDDHGWRVVVPAAAIDRIARSLGATGG